MINVKRTVTQEIEVTELQVGDIFEVCNISFIVIGREENIATIQQYDHVKNHVFNDNNSNQYEGSDLQEYVHGEYKEQFSKEFLQSLEGDFFILTLDDFDKYPFLNSRFNRIRLDEDGDPTWYWSASPCVDSSIYVHHVHPAGGITISNSGTSWGVAPACRINLDTLSI